ncbi:UNVERIFIED_CONTAM: hypothetical protein Sangu_2755900 [Sesamum angustifolium]|uniref:Retroviral polymerase SH3-like domain-containing protein n=1 Tax=Sesamum angustifolium TaxID=2727405 RepID=A0AAW2IV23_9LAMI
MSNDVQKQYDRLDDVASILQRMKEVYAIPNRQTRYIATKEFFRAKMTEGSSVQEHGVKMLSLVEKLEDLKVGLDNDTYIDVILQLLHRSYDPSIVNFNMNGLEKSINKLINLLVKGKRARRWKRKKDTAKAITVVIAKDAKSTPVTPVGTGKGKRKMGAQQQSRANNIYAHCREKRHWKRDCPNLSPNQSMFIVEVLQRSRKLSKDEVVLRLGDGKAIAAEVGYALETTARLLNIAPSKTVAEIPYQIWHSKPDSYKYLRMWGSSAYIKRLVEDKLDSKSSLCWFIGYAKEITGYSFYEPSEQKVFVSRNAVFLKRGFPADTLRDELLLEESGDAP